MGRERVSSCNCSDGLKMGGCISVSTLICPLLQAQPERSQIRGQGYGGVGQWAGGWSWAQVLVGRYSQALLWGLVRL